MVDVVRQVLADVAEDTVSNQFGRVVLDGVPAAPVVVLEVVEGVAVPVEVLQVGTG